MASVFVPTSSAPLSLSLLLPTASPTILHFRQLPTPREIRLDRRGLTSRRERMGYAVVTRAGPSASTYLLAFAIPLTLLVATIFTSIKIADKLDRDYIEEVALNEAIRGEGEGEDDDDAELSFDEIIQEPVPSRTRNRPKREV